MKVNVPEVDFGHEELIDGINALGEHLRTGAPDNEIQALLGKIHAQIEAHFALEEKIMRSRGYAGFEAHKEDHDRLLEQIRDIMDEAPHLNTEDLRRRLAQRLTLWFTEHFRTLDRAFHTLTDA